MWLFVRTEAGSLGFHFGIGILIAQRVLLAKVAKLAVCSNIWRLLGLRDAVP
jgi:hypothetical protein